MAWLKKAEDYRNFLFLNLHRRNVVNAGIVFFIVVVAVCFLTNDKTPKTRSASQAEVHKESVIDYKEEETNPLLRNQRSDIEQLVEEYYQSSAKASAYAEKYGNIAVYTKEGPYEDSYLAFVSYEMKIKEIPTLVPGLGTFYIEKQPEQSEYQMVDKITDDKIKEFVKTAANHTDVQELMGEVQSRYENALKSDATLQEAMNKLQAAYEDNAPKVTAKE